MDVGTRYDPRSIPTAYCHCLLLLPVSRPLSPVCTEPPRPPPQHKLTVRRTKCRASVSLAAVMERAEPSFSNESNESMDSGDSILSIRSTLSTPSTTPASPHRRCCCRRCASIVVRCRRLSSRCGEAPDEARQHRWGDAVPASRSDGVMERGRSSKVLKFSSLAAACTEPPRPPPPVQAHGTATDK